MTKLTIDSLICVQGALDFPKQSIENLKRRLKLSNPDYELRRRLRLPLWGCPSTITLYQNLDKGNTVILPRGHLVTVLSEIQRLGVEETDWGGTVKIEDNRLELPKVQFKSSIGLRGYQAPALQAVRESEQGVIIAPAGSGKTETGLAIIADLGQPALWLTHTTDLVDQALNRAKDKLHLDPGEWGVYGAGEHTIGTHITFATVQTLNKMEDDKLIAFARNFGAVIVDEAHHCAAGIEAMAMFERVISFMPARYRVGLTASEHRSDGLMETVFLILGPKIYEVQSRHIKPYLITPNVAFVPTEFEFTYDETEHEFLPFSQMLAAMSKDEDRNKLILKYIEKDKDHYCLILGDSLTHLEYLHDTVQLASDAKAAFIHGGTPRRARELILDRVRNGEIHYLFATYALAREGLDIPRLDRLFLITPRKDKTVIQQAIGRVSRKAPGKDGALVYDFWDQKIPTCTKHARARIKDVYNVQECKIYGGPTRRKNKEVYETLKNAFNEED